MRFLRYTTLIFLILAAANVNISAQDEEIFRALKDELNRNMDELGESEDYTSPFFLEFGLNDYEFDAIYASLGSLMNSKNNKGKAKSVRIMVGDYDLSDENFNDNTAKVNHNDGNIALPLKSDYMAIRRSFWITTNNVFKMASETYRNKLSAMKLKGLTKDDLQAADLTRETPVVDIQKPYENDYNERKTIKALKKYSSMFAAYPEIHFSQVSFFRVNALRYLVNNEGTEISIPFRMYVMHVAAIMPDEDQHPIWQQMIYYGNSYEELLSGKTVEEDIKALAVNLYAEAKAEKFDEKYIGPMMFEDFAVVEQNFIRLFSSSTESLIGRRLPLVNNMKDGLVIPSRQTWEHRMDKRVVDKKISIYDLSDIAQYNNEPLIGKYKIDNQGVKPADTLILIQEGLLKKQLVSRTPTNVQDKSTGHLRTGIADNNLMTALAPGVVHVKSSETIPYSEMKQKLIESGKEEGLDFVIYAKSIETSANNNPVNFYKVDVANGNEKLVRKVQYRSDISDLRDILYVSDQERVYNTLFFRGGLGYTRGVPVSFITPGAIILKETNISGDANSIKGELPVVPSPLTIGQ